MRSCPSCSASVTAEQSFCGSCGRAIETESELATKTSVGDTTQRPPTRAWSSTSDAHRFLPGTVIAERYRIVGVLGKGGMGEVYRADDLKLGQSVALKFLPEALESDPERKARLLTEVKMARQVSHPNVCRVYDIGELEGTPFLSMEFVDGEDLASLLLRIGRLPREKAMETARQICAGLAAAHEQGILHRDLKPGNVMIDGRGRVKITDFGLAEVAGNIRGAEAMAGTPAYMAPEQLSGRHASIRSDIYALGLVLYELVTGKPAYRGRNLEEISRKQKSQPPLPSSIIGDLDEATERVILRCLERDPRARPGSALAVAAALPGGDPLAAALAAGETPSPELVVEAGAAGGLRPALAIALLVVAFLGIAVNASRTDTLERRVPFDLSADELEVRAVNVLEDLGYRDFPGSRLRGFAPHADYLDWVERNDKSATRWNALGEAQPPGVLFYFRFAASEIKPLDAHAYLATDVDPPLVDSGSALLRLDTLGRLYELRAIPRDFGEREVAETDETFDWTLPVDLAGLSVDKLTEIPPRKPPSSPVTELRAWRVEESWGGEGVVLQMGRVGTRLTYFEFLGPWNTAKVDGDSGTTLSEIFFGLLFATTGTVAFVLAYRNLRARRSDIVGATRVAVLTVVTMMLGWLFVSLELKTFDLRELMSDITFGRPLAHALLHTTLGCGFYLALEPYVRRLWPHTLVSWTRLLRGRLRDPLVGRDVLFGFGLGTVFAVIGRLALMIETNVWGVPAPRPLPGPIGWRGDLSLIETASRLLNDAQVVLYIPLGALVSLMLMRLLLRRDWAAITALALLFGPLGMLTQADALGLPPLLLASRVVISFAGVAVVATALSRVGLLVGMSTLSFGFLGGLPLTLDLTEWYASSSVLVMLVYTAIAVWAFYTALAGRPVFKDLLDESP